MDELIKHVVDLLVTYYELLQTQKFPKSQMIVKMQNSLLKQLLVIKAKNDHDEQSKLISSD